MKSNEKGYYPDYLKKYVEKETLDRLGKELPPLSDGNLLIAGGGLDLTGKTTTFNNLAQATGATKVYCMDKNPLTSMRKLFDKAPTVMRYLYYIGVPLLNYQRLENLREQGNVLLDQSVYGTIAYHLAHGLDSKFLKLIPPPLLNQIDALLFFTVPRKVRLERLEQRKQQDPSKVTFSDRKSFEVGEKVEKHYLEIKPEITSIVTTHDQPEMKVVETILGNLHI